MTASNKVLRLNELKQQLFVLKMKDNFTHDDLCELDRLRKEVNEITKGGD